MSIPPLNLQFSNFSSQRIFYIFTNPVDQLQKKHVNIKEENKIFFFLSDKTLSWKNEYIPQKLHK